MKQKYLLYFANFSMLFNDSWRSMPPKFWFFPVFPKNKNWFPQKLIPLSWVSTEKNKFHHQFSVANKRSDICLELKIYCFYLRQNEKNENFFISYRLFFFILSLIFNNGFIVKTSGIQKLVSFYLRQKIGDGIYFFQWTSSSRDFFSNFRHF